MRQIATKATELIMQDARHDSTESQAEPAGLPNLRVVVSGQAG